MDDEYIAVIKLFGGNFAPRNWKFCNGQLLLISQFNALFSLLGTIYGGDGRTTFALPDLRGRVPVGFGNGPGLRQIPLGSRSGSETNTLTVAQLPRHTHTATAIPNLTISASSEDGSTSAPEGNYLAKGFFEKSRGESYPIYPYSGNGANTTLNSDSISGSVEVNVGNTGVSQPVNNRQPYTGMNYIICIQGLYPSRS